MSWGPLLRLHKILTPSWFAHLLCGAGAFLTFEVCLRILLSALDLSRNPGFFFFEFLIFLLTSQLIYLYDQIHRLNRPQRPSGFRLGRSTLPLEAFAEGVRDSLSAIMFFARASLVGAKSGQEARDLREVMERVDQLQMLFQEMHVLSSADAQPGAGLEDSAILGNSETSVGEGISRSAVLHEKSGQTRVMPQYRLRRSSRKVLVLPVRVRYVEEENNLEFQAYTVNVTEEGACIILSNDSLATISNVDVQMSPNFEAGASIKWIQQSGENALRLAGIEFTGRRYPVNQVLASQVG